MEKEKEIKKVEFTKKDYETLLNKLNYDYMKLVKWLFLNNVYLGCEPIGAQFSF